MATYTYRCDDCGCISYEQFKYEERPEAIKCLACQGIADYTIDAPGLTKASYIDGTKRKGWGDLREASKLQRAAAVSRPDTAKEIRKEIRRMGIKLEK